MCIILENSCQENPTSVSSAQYDILGSSLAKTRLPVYRAIKWSPTPTEVEHIYIYSSSTCCECTVPRRICLRGRGYATRLPCRFCVLLPKQFSSIHRPPYFRFCITYQKKIKSLWTTLLTEDPVALLYLYI